MNIDNPQLRDSTRYAMAKSEIADSQAPRRNRREALQSVIKFLQGVRYTATPSNKDLIRFPDGSVAKYA